MPADSRAARRPQLKTRITGPGLAVVDGVAALAAERGLTSSQLALRWVVDQPGVTAPIVGPRTMAHLEDALGVLDVRLDDAARAACDALVHPGNAVADFFNTVPWMRATV